MHLDLSGEWRIALDPNEVGIAENWQQSAMQRFDCITLPGSMTEAGYGDVASLDSNWTGSIYDRSWFHEPELERFRATTPPHFPFWLTPLKHYVGVVWYEREITISETQVNQPFRVVFERPHWQTVLWVDGETAGQCNSLCVPHVFDHPGFTCPGKHRLTLLIDNAIRDVNPGQDAHSISDHTQGNWNGVVGAMKLEFLPDVEIQSVQLYADRERELLTVQGLLSGAQAVRGNLLVELFPAETHLERTIEAISSVQTCVVGQSIYHNFELELSLRDIEWWDEFNPALYCVRIRFRTGDGQETEWQQVHGFREFGKVGTHFTLNGRKLFLRGNVDCCVFPLTGYAPMELERWLEYFGVIQDNGFNHVRFHSWCPPRAAFLAADKLGVILQVEAPTWPNHGVAIGEGDPIDDYLYHETERILEAYGNHASLCLVASGNEPYGNRQVEFLSQYVRHFRELDRRQLYTGASVGTKWPFVRESDFIVHSQPRGLPYEQTAPHACFDFSEEIDGFDQPFMSHEMGQFCVFPDFSEIERYTGVNRALNLEMYRERFLENFCESKASVFLQASGQLQLACYKAEIEAALRTQDLAGIQLLGANDFPGQGTALIGWLNAFYQTKPYVEADYLKRFLAPTVLLVRTSKFVYRSSETVEWILEVAHFGPEDIVAQNLCWNLRDETHGDIIEEGKLPFSRIETGKVTVLTMVNIALDQSRTPCKCTFELELGGYRNEWNIWVYPDFTDQLAVGDHSLLIAEGWSDQVSEAIETGRDVLLLAGQDLENGKDIIQYFRPAFWNTSWFQMAPPHTLGLSIDETHPIFRDFVTDSYSDFQWWELVQEQPVANLELFPEVFQPIVQPIDTWFINRRLGLLFEFRVGQSRVVFCTADLRDCEAYPVRSQLKQSILKYMQGSEFTPAHEIPESVLAELFEVKERKCYDVMTDEKPEELIPPENP